MDITICMTSFNRKPQMLNTLKSFQKYDSKRFNVVIVDDWSSAEHILTQEEILKFDFKITYVAISAQNKWWVNPCFAFNLATTFVDTEKMIIQNAECYHENDIFSAIDLHLIPKKYIAFSCFALNQNVSPENFTFNDGVWYSHPEYNPRPLNFCSAIYTNDFNSFNGFDLDFAKGIWYDDDMLLKSMERAGIEITLSNSGLALHQWHESNWNVSNFEELKNINLNLLNNK